VITSMPTRVNSGPVFRDSSQHQSGTWFSFSVRKV
jgi:hypothetical protein